MVRWWSQKTTMPGYRLRKHRSEVHGRQLCLVIVELGLVQLWSPMICHSSGDDNLFHFIQALEKALLWSTRKTTILGYSAHMGVPTWWKRSSWVSVALGLFKYDIKYIVKSTKIGLIVFWLYVLRPQKWLNEHTYQFSFTYQIN